MGRYEKQKVVVVSFLILTYENIQTYIYCMKTHQEIDRRSLALMKAVVEKIDLDPKQWGLKKARSVCKRWTKMHDNTYISKWDDILTRPWNDIRAILLDKTEEAAALRQCNPFCGILTPKERWRIYREFRKNE